MYVLGVSALKKKFKKFGRNAHFWIDPQRKIRHLSAILAWFPALCRSATPKIFLAPFGFEARGVSDPLHVAPRPRGFSYIPDRTQVGTAATPTWGTAARGSVGPRGPHWTGRNSQGRKLCLGLIRLGRGGPLSLTQKLSQVPF